VEKATIAPGNLHTEKRRLLVGCGESTALELLEVQPAGKKRMSTEAFLNGYKITEGERIGEPS
jgi:methionyl-tRNA formyltransferase